MPYCRDCGAYISSSTATYCYDCEQDIVDRSRRSVNRASDDERRRMNNDRDYAHSWLQDVIGWITALWGILSKVFSGGGCYITTAVVERKGLDDKSPEMEKLRKFRKEYILDSNNPELLNDLEQYYIIGQIIVRWANSRYDSNQIWDYISKFVFEVVDFVDCEEYERAYLHFKKKTLNIQKDILANKHKNALQHAV